MLETLRKHDPKEAARILSSVTAELLPNPEVGGRYELPIDPGVHSELWTEIRRRAKVDPANTSLEMKSRIFEFLFTEMTQLALPRSGLESVKARLSFKGELRPDLYEVQINAISFIPSKEHGVRPNHVLEAIRNADAVDHLNLLDNEVLLSLFLRIHHGNDPFALLVLAARVSSFLDVGFAMRVYRSEVDYSAANTPTDVLRLVVAKYGLFLTIGHLNSKLILNETFTFERSARDQDFIKVNALEGASIFGTVVWRKLRLHNSYGVALGFALDQVKYAADLRKHGVQVGEGVYHLRTSAPGIDTDDFKGQ